MTDSAAFDMLTLYSQTHKWQQITHRDNNKKIKKNIIMTQ